MARGQGGPQRLGGQGEVSFPGQRQGPRSRALPVLRAGPALQLRRAGVRGDLSRRERRRRFETRRLVMKRDILMCVSFVSLFMLKGGRGAVVEGGGPLQTNFYFPVYFEKS